MKVLATASRSEGAKGKAREVVLRVEWECDDLRAQLQTLRGENQTLEDVLADERAELAHAVEVENALTQEKAVLEARERALREALEPFGSGHVWGLVKVWIVAGAPNRVDGLDFAQRLTRYQAEADAALAPRRG